MTAPIDLMSRLSGGRRFVRPVAWGVVLFWTIPSLVYFLGFDQINYQAAAERLNAGHSLYTLGPGDRVVSINPPFWYAPLLYPPTIAVLWRPLVLVPVGAPAWWLASAAALIAATAWVVRISPMVVMIASAGVGVTLASGNVAGLLAAGTVLTWIHRDNPLVGALIGLMIAIKLTPASLVVWLIATRRWLALAWVVAAGLLIAVVDLAGAGWENSLAYLGVVQTKTTPVPLSLPGLTGIPATAAIILGLVATLAARSDIWSHRFAILTSVLGSPFVGVGSLVGLLPLGVAPWSLPFTSRRRLRGRPSSNRPSGPAQSGGSPRPPAR